MAPASLRPTVAPSDDSRSQSFNRPGRSFCSGFTVQIGPDSPKTLAEFDFSFQPSLRREQIDSLHELAFLKRRENVVFVGPPGVGKTHLAISLAVAAADSGRRIYFGTLGDLINSLDEAHAAGRLQQRLKTLTHPALLVVDEIGYLSVTAKGAKLFFQLINSRYGRASTVLTSNKGFEDSEFRTS